MTKNKPSYEELEADKRRLLNHIIFMSDRFNTEMLEHLNNAYREGLTTAIEACGHDKKAYPHLFAEDRYKPLFRTEFL